MKRRLLSSIALAALLPVVASAADLPTRPAHAAGTNDVSHASPKLDRNLCRLEWWLWMGSQDPLNLITNRFDRTSIGFSGGVFGGTAGAQIQSGHVVLGLEADLDWAGLKGSGDNSSD